MVKEVHEITETLIKIKAGTLSSKELDALNFDQNVFLNAAQNANNYDDFYGEEMNDDYYGEEGYDDDDYGIGQHRGIQKQLSKKASQRKVTNKQLSSILTAQVNKKHR